MVASGVEKMVEISILTKHLFEETMLLKSTSSEIENKLVSDTYYKYVSNMKEFNKCPLRWLISVVRLFWFKQGLLNAILSENWFQNELEKYIPLLKCELNKQRPYMSQFQSFLRLQTDERELVFDRIHIEKTSGGYEFFVMVILSWVDFRNTYDVFEFLTSLNIDVFQNSFKEGKIIFPENFWNILIDEITFIDGSYLTDDKLVLGI